MEYKIKEKLKYLKNYNIPINKKIEFIEKLYKLANISFDIYSKNWQNNKN